MDKSSIDLLVSFDTTGSMYPVLAQVRQKVDIWTREMLSTFDDIRIGIIAHGDYCDKNRPYTIKALNFTKDKAKISDFITNTPATGGGDADECYELVLHTALENLDWRDNCEKVYVLIGDASPHGVDYPDNIDHLDWRAEAKKLADAGVKIYGVHALSHYRNSSYNFYSYISKISNGKYLKLDNFNDITQLIMMTAISRFGEEKLNEYVSIIQDMGQYNRSLDANYTLLTGKQTKFTREHLVQKDGLVPVAPGRFQTMRVEGIWSIRDFVNHNGIKFKRGRAFYELTKHEKVQQYKEVIMQDYETGDLFTGAQVREKLGLSPQVESGGVTENLSSKNLKEFRVFVQSTSVNRKLVPGTTLLYEISDLSDTSSVIDSRALESDSGKPATDTNKSTKSNKGDKSDPDDKLDTKLGKPVDELYSHNVAVHNLLVNDIIIESVVTAINRRLKEVGKTPSEYFEVYIRAKSVTKKNLVEIIEKSIKKFGVNNTKLNFIRLYW